MNGKRGANLIYVVILVALLGLLAAAYSGSLIHAAKAAARQREEIQTHYTDKTLLTAYTATLTENENAAFDALLAQVNAKWQAYLNDLEEWTEDQGDDDGKDNDDVETAPSFTSYVNPSYQATGEGTLADDEGNLSITMVYKPSQVASGTQKETLKVTLTRTKGDKIYTTGVLLAQTRIPTTEENKYTVPALNPWEVERYYEN